MPLGKDPEAVKRVISEFKADIAKSPDGVTYPYTENYKEVVFQNWYQSGRTHPRQLIKMLPPDEYKRVPSWQIIMNWVRLFGWTARADELDKDVKNQLNIQYAETRVEMMKRHADVGKEMQRKGIDFLLENPLDKPADAIKLVTEGVRIEKDSAGIAEALEKVAKLKDTPLRELITQLVSRLPDEEKLQLDTGITLDEDEIEEGEFVDEMMPDADDSLEGSE